MTTRATKAELEQALHSMAKERDEMARKLGEARVALARIQGFCWTAWLWGSRGNKIAGYASEGLRRS